MNELELDVLVPDWPAAASVHAFSTTRSGGCSTGPYASLNLGAHVGDQPALVNRNRQRLINALRLPAAPQWLNQIHGTDVVSAHELAGIVDADGSTTHVDGVVCAVMTADCLPVLLCNRAGTEVAALHAGWRGLVNGVLEAGVTAMQSAPQELLAWIGPAIGADAFEVGGEVREAFLEVDEGNSVGFTAHRQRWLADLARLARLRLRSIGVTEVYGGHWCTHADDRRFFSYRRDGVTGRQVSLVWLG